MMPFVRCGSVGFYFCHIPRTAGRCVLQALVQSGCEIDFSIAHGSHPHPFTKEWSFKWRGVPSIAVVRDPISRFISAMSYESRCVDKADMFQQVRVLRRLPDGNERHFSPQVGFVQDSTRLYTFEHGLSALFQDLRDFGFVKESIKFEPFNLGGRPLDVTPTEKRIHLEKMKRFYRQDIALHVKAREAEKLRGVFSE